MAVVYGQPLPGFDSVQAYSNQLRQQKLNEANQRRQDRIAFGKALEKRQLQDTEKRHSEHVHSHVSTQPKSKRLNAEQRRQLKALGDKATSTPEYKAYLEAGHRMRGR